MKYRTIFADPPWNERGGGKIKRGADKHYPLMKTKDICAMGPAVQELHEPEAHLWLWAVNTRIEDAYQVVRAWGAKPITMLTWRKLGKLGLGQYARGKTEHLIFARWGCPPYKQSFDPLPEDHPNFLMRRSDGRHQTITEIPAVRGAHSEKPQEFRQVVEWMSYGPMLEMFARKPVPTWSVWGNEVESDIEPLDRLFSKRSGVKITELEDLF